MALASPVAIPTRLSNETLGFLSNVARRFSQSVVSTPINMMLNYFMMLVPTFLGYQTHLKSKGYMLVEIQ